MVVQGDEVVGEDVEACVQSPLLLTPLPTLTLLG